MTALLITPLLTLIVPTAPLPLPVTVTRFTPATLRDPSAGVYPIPALLIESQLAEPATPTSLPIAFVAG